MFADIVFPKNNEQEFVQIASRLGIKKLYFTYDFNYYNEEKIQKKIDALKQNGLSIKTAIIVNQKNLSKMLHNSKPLIAKSSDSDRLLIDGKKIKLIYGFEQINRKDYLSQRASGLNHITCEAAKKNNVAIGFCYSSLLGKNYPAYLLIGRMMQNISFCQKYKVKTIIGSFSENPFDLRAPHDVAGMFAMLGMDGKKIKESLMH